MIGESVSNVIPTDISPNPLAVLVSSPLTPTSYINCSTPHEPSQQHSLIDCFDPIISLDEADEAEYYDSDCNISHCVDDSHFKHFEIFR